MSFAQDIQNSGHHIPLSSQVVSSLHMTAPPGRPLPHVAKHMLPERTYPSSMWSWGHSKTASANFSLLGHSLSFAGQLTVQKQESSPTQHVCQRQSAGNAQLPDFKDP